MEIEEKREKYREKGSARNQIFTALVATVPTFTYGIQIGWLSPMAAILKSAMTPARAPLTGGDISWMAAALPLAAIVGIPFFSYSSDRFGRKISIILCSLLSCISWIMKLTAGDAGTFIAARMFAGLAASGCFVVVPVYIREISEDAWRGALGSLVMTMCKVGVIGVYALGMSLSYTTNQAVYLTICGLHVLGFAFMPESPNYLVKIGEETKAAKTLAWLRCRRRDDAAVRDEVTKLKLEHRAFLAMPKITLMSVVRDRPAFSALRLTLTLMAMQTLSGCFALMNYAADMFARAGAEWSPDTLALIMGSLQMAGSAFTTVTIDKFGRKIPLALSSLTVSACMAALATCFLLPAAPRWLPVLAVCACILAYGVGLAPVPMVIMAEVFSFELRARMAGASMAFSFFCSSMTVLFYNPAVNLVIVFYTFASVGLLGFIYTILWVPETKGKTLEEIQAHWKDKNPPPTFV